MGMSNDRDPTDAGEPVYTIDNPPPARPAPEATAAAEWERILASPTFDARRRGHLHPRFLERVPIRLYGVGQFDECFGRCFFLYRDTAGEPRALRPEEHDRAGIAALFAGDEGYLLALWPADGGGWDDERAAEALMFFQGCIGLVDPAALGFEPPDEQ